MPLLLILSAITGAAAMAPAVAALAVIAWLQRWWTLRARVTASLFAVLLLAGAAYAYFLNLTGYHVS